MNFATNLKLARASKSIGRRNKISQERLAMDLGITRSMVASYEQGLAQPDFCLLIKMSKYFDVTIDDLLK